MKQKSSMLRWLFSNKGAYQSQEVVKSLGGHPCELGHKKKIKKKEIHILSVLPEISGNASQWEDKESQGQSKRKIVETMPFRC